MNLLRLAPIDLSTSWIGLGYDGRAVVLAAGGPHPSIDGYTVGAPTMTRSAPHSGERHPDGDEVLYLVSGRVEVLVEDGQHERKFGLTPDEGSSSLQACGIESGCVSRAISSI